MRNERLEINNDGDQERKLAELALDTYVLSTDYLGLVVGDDGSPGPYEQYPEEFAEYEEANHDQIILIEDGEVKLDSTEGKPSEVITIHRKERYVHIECTTTPAMDTLSAGRAKIVKDQIILAPDGTLADIASSRGLELEQASPRKARSLTRQLSILQRVNEGISRYVRHGYNSEELFADSYPEPKGMSALDIELLDLDETEYISGDFSVVLDGSGVTLDKVYSNS